MRVLYLGEEPRYMLGSAAALSSRGIEVYYMRLARNSSQINIQYVPVETRIGHPVKICQIMTPFPRATITKIKDVTGSIDIPPQLNRLLKDLSPEVIITRSDAWAVAHTISKRLNIPLIIYIASIRGIKLFSFIKFAHEYKEIFMAPLSILYNAWQSHLSNLTLTWSRKMKEYLRKMGIKKVVIIRPPYARYRFTNIQKKIKIPKPYVLTIVTINRPGEASKKIELTILRLVLLTAHKVPNTSFVIVGTSQLDFKKISYSVGIDVPKNVKFMGRVSNDNLLASLYQGASLVLCPVLLPGFSNRLLEALFYGRPILTTSIIASFYDGLINGEHAVIEDDFRKYSDIVSEIVYDEKLRGKLVVGAREYYEKFFSPEAHGVLLERVISIFIRRK